MKIYILKINKLFQPVTQPFLYPSHNSDYGVEQDFFLYLKKNSNYVTDSPKSADFHYLPVYWTRWHLNNNYGTKNLDILQEEVQKVILDDNKTFTICQYDDGPKIDLGKTIVFLASRKTKKGYDIPLLCKPHRIPLFKPPKKYLATFIGRVKNHKLREKMLLELKSRDDIFIYDGIKDENFFVKNILASYICLSPRGYGGSSFRFFEALQLGIVPLLIGDLDTRPFKKYIDWSKYSLFINNLNNINSLLDSLDIDKLNIMGQEGKKLYKDELVYRKWCKYILYGLESIMLKGDL